MEHEYLNNIISIIMLLISIVLGTKFVNYYYNFYHIYTYLDYEQKLSYFKNTYLINMVSKYSVVKKITVHYILIPIIKINYIIILVFITLLYSLCFNEFKKYIKKKNIFNITNIKDLQIDENDLEISDSVMEKYTYIFKNSFSQNIKNYDKLNLFNNSKTEKVLYNTDKEIINEIVKEEDVKEEDVKKEIVKEEDILIFNNEDDINKDVKKEEDVKEEFVKEVEEKKVKKVEEKEEIKIVEEDKLKNMINYNDINNINNDYDTNIMNIMHFINKETETNLIEENKTINKKEEENYKNVITNNINILNEIEILKNASEQNSDYDDYVIKKEDENKKEDIQLDTLNDYIVSKKNKLHTSDDIIDTINIEDIDFSSVISDVLKNETKLNETKINNNSKINNNLKINSGNEIIKIGKKKNKK